MLYGIEAVYAVYAVGQEEKIQQYQVKIEFRGQRGDAVICGRNEASIAAGGKGKSA